MKTSKTAIVLLALGASAWMVSAQDGNGPPPRSEGQQRREGQGGTGGPGNPGGLGGPGGPGQFAERAAPGRMGQHLPPPPVIAVLDANHDGVIDKEEIANAKRALKKLDKNRDGKLTMEELRPPLPEGNFRPGGPEGQRAFGERRGPDDRRGLDERRGPENRRGSDDRRPGGFEGPRGPDREGDQPQPRREGQREDQRDDRPQPPPREN